MRGQRERVSEARLKVRRCQDEVSALVDQLQEGGALIRGSLYTRERQCGKRRCRCVEGEPHRDRVWAVRRGGRMAVRRLGSGNEERIEAGVAAWRVFRKRRGKLARACRELMKAVDGLGRLKEAGAGEIG